MPKFNVSWSMMGTAVVEADDANEAEDIVAEGLPNFDHSMMDELTVDEFTVDSDGVVGEGDG